MQIPPGNLTVSQHFHKPVSESEGREQSVTRGVAVSGLRLNQEVESERW